MNYNWNEYKIFSEIIENLESDKISEETKIRNSISRMFYHAFHCLLNWVETKSSYSFKAGTKTHLALIEHLMRTRHIDKAKKYKKLKELREQCDYEDHIDNLNQKLFEAKDLHKQLVEPLAKFSQR